MTAPRRLVCFFSAWIVALAAPAHAVVFSGEVRAESAQPVFCPPSDSSPVVLRYYVPDGAQVKAGDVLLRIDAGPAAQQIRTLEGQIEQGRAKVDKEVAELRLKLVDAELALIDAQAAFDTAKVDAAIPKQLISALDYDRHQAEFDRTGHDADLKQHEADDARAAVARRSADGKLEIEKLQVQQVFYGTQVEMAEVRADRDGTLVHGFSRWFGNRLDEGASSFPGQEVGTVTGADVLSVRAWVLEPDRPGLATGQTLRLTFDALPGRTAAGKITSISGASESRQEWGAGRYYVVDVEIPNHAGLALRPGMSARVESEASAAEPASTAGSTRIPGAAPKASGEVYAQSTAAISPPIVEDLWQLTVTQMAGDGAPVKKGDALVSFDGAEVMKSLTAKRSELEEKKRTQEKLRLELAEKARTEAVTAAEAHADATKAQRKASQPEAYVPGVEYKKLLIARRKAEQKEAKSREREGVAADERAAEQRAADADVKRLGADVERMQSSLNSLNLTAPRDGIFLHATMPWSGEKIEIGKQVWRGMSVGEIPDVGTLAVRASLPERDLGRVKAGDRVRITLEGGSSQTLSGHIESIGLGVHSKSKVEPVPVVDLHIALDTSKVALKPGQPVQVEIVQNAKLTSS
jgi:multidrug resistance efflux pump